MTDEQEQVEKIKSRWVRRLYTETTCQECNSIFIIEEPEEVLPVL